MAKFASRRSFVLIATAGLLAGLAVTALPMAAAAKPAPAPSSIGFGTATQSLLSTAHKHLLVSINANASGAGATLNESVQVNVSRKGALEFHSWAFTVKKGSLTFNPKTGKGALKVGSQLLPYGSITLSLTAVGKSHTVICHTSRSVTQPVKVHGVLSFNTRSTGKSRWGKVGGPGARSFSGKSSVSEQFGDFQVCGGSTGSLCFTNFSWSADKEGPGFNETDLSGSMQRVGGKTRKTVSAFRNVSLAKPNGATRFDSISAADKNMTFSQSKGLASVRIGAGGPVTGTATLVSTTAGNPFSIPCGKSSTQTTTNWIAPYQNGKTPLVIHEQIEGNFHLANRSGNIDKNSVS